MEETLRDGESRSVKGSDTLPPAHSTVRVLWVSFLLPVDLTPTPFSTPNLGCLPHPNYPNERVTRRLGLERLSGRAFD